jgi:DNA mismatch endonuclease, patch repair protein
MTTPDLPPPPAASSPAVRAVMQGNRSRDTRPEAAVRSALHRAGLRFRKHVRPLPGLRCEADVVFARQKVALFVDGCFWHGCPVHGKTPKGNRLYWSAKIARNVARDQRNDAALAGAGWVVVRAWEHEDPAEVVSRVQFALAAA